MSAGGSVVFFADGSEETSTLLQRLLHVESDKTLLSQFLSGVKSVLKDEALRLSCDENRGLPKFQDLHDFIRPGVDESRRHPALHPTEIVIVQLGYFIAAYEEHPEERYPDSERDLILGFCFGEISAAAVCLSKSLPELLPLAVEAVRLAFRAGILASTTGEDLEQRTEPAQCWSATVLRFCGLGEKDELDRVCSQIDIPEHRRPYVSAYAKRTITLGGPPSALRVLLSHLETTYERRIVGTPLDVRIYAPYHANRLFSKEDACSIVDTSPSSFGIFHEKVLAPHTRTCIGSARGRYHDASSRRELIKSILYDILAEPVDMEATIEGCRLYIEASDFPEWVVKPFGQTTAARTLANALGNIADRRVVMDDSLTMSVNNLSGPKKFPIAIVGMAGRFPNAPSPDALWDVLKSGLDCHIEIPQTRFNARTHLSRPAYGCFIDQPGLFDSRFFNMSPREALQTDPGQRLALVTAYEALEMSGFVPNRTPSSQLERIGTFNGQTSDEYKEQNMAQEVGTYFIPGSMRAFAPGRINHFFKFGGPAYSFDTACSTSSVALHVACNSIWSGECDTAVVGGMNIISSSDNYNGLTAGHFLSPTGGCKTFDNDADGYCRGEAVASVVIKPLAEALADNDNILATILSTATNYSAGADSITRPYRPAQESIYEQALNCAGINASDVDYIEMHGTGTQVGDSVEMASVSNIFAPASPQRSVQNPLYIGAVKANVGHGESASGITGLIKTLLILREESIPPHIGIKGSINKGFPDLNVRNLRIPLQMTPLPSKISQGSKRRVLLNNFSAAGGNTVCVLEEPPRHRLASNSDKRSHHTVAVTAKSKNSLLQSLRRLLAFIREYPDVSLSDLSYTTTVRRIQHPLRKIFLAPTVSNLEEQLATSLSPADLSSPMKLSQICFAFTGQGSVYPGMARDLFESSSQFRSDLKRFDELSRARGFTTFLPLIQDDQHDLENLPLALTHLALIAVEMALYRLFQSYGVSPTLVIGHSLGEYAAFYAAGILTAIDTLYLVGQRAVLIENSVELRSHSMMAVNADSATIRDTLSNLFIGLEVSCINGPHDVVLSGNTTSIRNAAQLLQSQGFVCKVLNVPVAYHSSQLDLCLDAFEEKARLVSFRRPRVPIASPLLGEIVTEAGIIGPKYLRNHLRGCVNFHGALIQCELEQYSNSASVWLEIGPNPTLIRMVKASLGADSYTLPTLSKSNSVWASMGRSLSCLHSWGCTVSWSEYHRDFEHMQRLLDIPTYAFEEQDYWIPYQHDWLLDKGARSQKEQVGNEATSSEPLTVTVQNLVSKHEDGKVLSLVFETDLSSPSIRSVILGHIINGSGLCPASVYADIALTVANYIRTNHRISVPTSGIGVHEMEILHPILVPKSRPEAPQILQITVSVDLENGKGKFELATTDAKSSRDIINAKCLTRYGKADGWLHKWSRSAYLISNRIQDLKRGVDAGNTHKLFHGMIYKLFTSIVEYDNRFQGMSEVMINTSELEAVAHLKLHAERDSGRFFCSPFWIDSFVQLAGFIMNANDKFDSRKVAFISSGWGSLRLAHTIDPLSEYRVHVKMQHSQGSLYEGDASIFRGDDMIGLVKDLKFQQVPRSLLNTLIPISSPEVTLDTVIARTKAIPAVGAVQLRSSSKLRVKTTSTTPHERNKTSDVLSIIAQETGISVKELSNDIKFATIGVDSLLALTILSELRQNLNIDIRQDVFENFPTIGDFLQYLDTCLGFSDDSRGAVTIFTPMSNGSSSASSILNDHHRASEDQRLSDQIPMFRAIVSKEIGVSIEELGTVTDLSLLGLDSLMALAIADECREKLSLTVPVDVLNNGNSMADIEKVLFPDSAVHISPPPQIRSAAPVSQATSFLLQGNPKSDGALVFLFPDGSGSAASYTKLPEVSPGVSVVGLNSPFLRQGTKPSFSVEDLADSFAREIRSKQPKGPYLLAGWSAGGYYAFETTKKLMQAGEKVEKLILVDSPPRNVYESMPLPVLDHLSEKNIMGGDSGKPPPQWLLDHFKITLAAVDRYSPSRLMAPDPPQTYIIWATDGVREIQGADDTNLDTSTKVTQFLLQRRSEFGPSGWDQLLPGGEMYVAKASGSHFSMVQAPHAQGLSRLIGIAVGNRDDAFMGAFVSTR